MVILLGGTGYAGGAFLRFFRARAIPYRVLSRAHVDYYQRDVLVSAIRRTGAEFLINAAGYTGKPNVDACESHKTDCLLGNSILPGIVRSACELAGIAWGHVSSGCIYTGTRPDGAGFSEKDPPNFTFRQNNCSFYSGCKALGEECLADAENVYIWRLRIPFNAEDSPRNYISKLLRYERLLEARNSLSHLDEFVRVCWQCYTRRVPPGIYNVTNTGSITTHEVVEMIDKFLKPARRFNFFESEEEFLRVAAITPRSSCVLDNSKLHSIGISVRTVQEALEHAMVNWKQTRCA
jgi:UDP-glucose 4,6-dehydratase